MAISAQTNVPQLPPFKVVTVGKNYTYLWPTVRKKYQGRIIDIPLCLPSQGRCGYSQLDASTAILSGWCHLVM